MIEIKNINISYGSQNLIKNSDIIIQDGVLTGISGPSGSGKTTLFYIIGLISGMRGYDYFYNGEKLDINDDHLKSSLRKKEIGFIFQDKNLHEYLSIEDNLKLYSSISGVPYSHEHALDILKKVQIDLDMTTKTKTLSGGEKQRLAIACALMKNPNLIIADEPTSALDDDNAKRVIDLLKQIASEGKMVIIASHNKEVLNQCQVKYVIDNQSLICHQQIDTSYQKGNIQKHSLLSHFYSWYAQFSFGRTKKERLLMLFIPSVVIALCMGSLSLKEGLMNYYEQSINEFSANEVLIENRDKDISSRVFNLLKQIEGVDNVQYVYSSFIEQLNITGTTTHLKSPIFIQSYFDFQKDYFQIDKKYDKGDIYISHSLAKKLNIKDSNKIEINNDSLNNTSYTVAGTFKQDYNLTQTKEQDVIYVPVKYFNQSASGTIILNLQSFQYLDGISDKITDINQNLTVVLSQSKYLSQISFLNMYRENLSTFLIVLISSVIILLSIINIFTMNSQKYEITVLKANGLSKIEMIKLMMYTTLRSVIVSILMVTIIVIIENIILLLMGMSNSIFNLKITMLSILFIFVVYSLPNLLSTLYLNHFDVEKILRF